MTNGFIISRKLGAWRIAAAGDPAESPCGRDSPADGGMSRDGASMRMVAAMAEPFLPAGRSLFEGEGVLVRRTPFVGEAAESDAQYYRRRAGEERRAAGEAAVLEARVAHQAIADRYALLAGVPGHERADQMRGPQKMRRKTRLGPLSEQAVRSPVTSR